MDKKYGKTPQQKLDESLQRALKQVIPNFKNIDAQSGKAKEIDASDLMQAMRSIENKAVYEVWQSNIAAAFIDEYSKLNPNMSESQNNMLYNIANNAAKNFLNSLCNQQSH